jgi:Protein of unknown function (DUF1549)/Protein of unknown function (DUF1553)/Planctomycete cytochrome C
MRLNLALSLIASPLVAAVPANHAEQMKRGLELFDGGVAEVLANACVKCHGGEKGTKGGLDIATREKLLEGGETGLAIVPGKSAESLLMKLIRHEDEPHMPEKGDKLSAGVAAKIAAWIDTGAPYGRPLIAGKLVKDRSKITDEDRKWWSFAPLQKAAPPPVRNEAWVRTPVDRYVLAKCETAGIQPNSAAGRRVLIRRAYLDLIGLPPTPDEVESFVADASPGAWAKVVDSLLASPHHGERWARHWLDLARYAESHGYEQDYDRPNAWHYRDYVIRALNRDQPYDEFVRWQIAGDELAPDEPDAWKATGFLAAGTHATQITANQAEKERYDELDDKIGTIGTAMLGLTIGCARCHDHKFDPIPTADYYRLISTFTKTVRSDHDLVVDSPERRAVHAAWEKEHAPLVAARERFASEQIPGRFEAWEKAGAKIPEPRWWTLDGADAKSAGGATFKKQADGSFLATGKSPDNDTHTFTVAAPTTMLTAVKLEALADKSLVKSGPGRAGNGNFALSTFELTITPPGGQPQPVKFASAIATFEQQGLPVAAAIDGDRTSAWAVDPQFGRNHAAMFICEKPQAVAPGSVLTLTLKFRNNAKHSIGRPRLSVTAEAQPTLDGAAAGASFAEVRGILSKPAAQRKPEEHAKLLAWFRAQDADFQKLDAAVAAHAAKEPKPAKEKVLVCSEGLPAVRLHTQGPDFYEKTYMLRRGDLAQKQGEAPQGFLQVLTRANEERWLTPPPNGARTPWRRASLAKWLTDTERGAGHLLARVIVNRLWQHHFGRGIVGTPSDFGMSGEKPAHPELLDFLAGELIRGGWRLKPIHRLLLTSATYMESGDGVKDSAPHFFARYAPRRLEAEPLRDSILAVTGTLDRRMFGAGTLDQAMKRRSIYFQIKRSQLVPMMTSFDGPDTLGGLGQRATTVVAPQALLLMNSRLVRDAAATWAKSLAELPDPVTAAYRAALSRPPAAEEKADAAAFLASQAAAYSGKQDAAHLALADFCQALLSLNEFAYVE